MSPLRGASGTIKGLTVEQLQALDCHVVLGNTYHLASRPGADVVAEAGGLHDFMAWPRGLLTDSGGFQMVCHRQCHRVVCELLAYYTPHG